jgi:hypothetical protein
MGIFRLLSVEIYTLGVTASIDCFPGPADTLPTLTCDAAVEFNHLLLLPKIQYFVQSGRASTLYADSVEWRL